MRHIGGIPIDVLKEEAGLSDADLESILEESEKYKERWRNNSVVQAAPEGLREQIVEIATNSFQTGMVIGIAKSGKIPNAAKKFGFAP